MNRKEQYRQEIMQHVGSLRAKSLYNTLVNETHDQFVPIKSIAEVVASKAYNLLVTNQRYRPDESIVLPVIKGRNYHKKIRFKNAEKVKVQITPCLYDDIEPYQSGGIKALQNARLCRIIEESYFQNGLFNSRLLACMLNMSLSSLRKRLKELWEKGFRLPLCGMNRIYRKGMKQFRATYAMRRYLDGDKVQNILNDLFLTRRDFLTYQLELVKVSKLVGRSVQEIVEITGCDLEQIQEYLELLEDVQDTPKYRYLEQETLYHKPSERKSWWGFADDLRNNHNWSPAKTEAYLEFLKEFFHSHRQDNILIYQAVKFDEPLCKAIDESRMLLVHLQYYVDEEIMDFNSYSTCYLRWKRIVRYTTQAKKMGAVLNHPDLVFLLGADYSVILRLMQKNKKTFIPIRENFFDIGPGLFHAEKVISLYLEGYTETQIKQRTQHTYDSIEIYIRNFAILVGLWEKGLTLPAIHQVMGKSKALVEKYKTIYDKYNTDDSGFFMGQIRRIFRGNPEIKKILKDVDFLS